MKHFNSSSLVLFVLVCTCAMSPDHKMYQYNYENVLGTSFELKVNANTENVADAAEQTALDEIDRLNNILSTYDANSEVSRWLKTYQTEVTISPELFEVFTLFDQWREKTDGALSPAAAIASQLWKTAMVNQKVPNQTELSSAAREMAQSQWRLNIEKQTAMHLTREPLVLSSFVKSYIIKKVSAKLMTIDGVTGVVVNIGGDIVVAGQQSETIRIADPRADAENATPVGLLNLQNKAIATSGNYRRGFQIGNQRFSHILDARTALPVSEIISATVIANNATDAGAMATAFNILSPKQSEILAAGIPDVEYQIITSAGRKIESEGWRKLTSENNAIEIKRTNAAAEEKFEASIDLELARFEGRSHRPFVAVWVENKSKESVRTVAVWFNKPRWLPDLRKWFSKNQAIAQDHSTIGSISSATRSAGKYTLVWDGLDDSGNTVSPGKYTIYIEAAREHGTYQLMKQDIDWKGKPNHFDIEGGIEITSASVDLHQKTAD